MTARLHLAVDLDGDGAHPAAWRYSGRPPGAVLTGRGLRTTVAEAERAGFTLATFDDGPLPPAAAPNAAGRLEAGTRAAFAATVTDRIGLAATLHVTMTEPFFLATQLASLDHASRGRAAWIVGATTDPGALATIGAAVAGTVAGTVAGPGSRTTAGAAAPAPETLRREVRDVVEVSRRLWDSWEDDAVVRDAATGRYLDADKVHHVDFAGATFSVKGPLITPRPPQGQVVVLAPDTLGLGDRADVALVAAPDPDAIAERAAHARKAGTPLVFAEVECVVGPDAAERAARLAGDAPWPDIGALRFTGTAQAFTALLSDLAGVVDGVRLRPAVLAADLPVLSADVLPALEAAGAHRPPEPGGTLRAALGLPRPANRFAVP